MTSFEDRQKDLFNQLNAAEKQANFVNRSKSSQADDEDRVIVKQNVRKTKAELKHFRGKESIFKRPEAPISHCLKSRKIPGYQKNPNKWTCYNLENVPTVSDRSNAEAAAVCLKEVELDKTTEDSMVVDEDKITFIPPVKDSDKNIIGETSDQGIDAKSSYVNSKITMPQYFVGQKASKGKKDKPDKNLSDKSQVQLRLEHLHDEEDE